MNIGKAAEAAAAATAATGVAAAVASLRVGEYLCWESRVYWIWRASFGEPQIDD